MERAAEAPTPFANPLEQLLGYQLRRASMAVMSALANDLATLDLNASHASLIVLIGANPGCTQSEISRALRASAANLVPLINQLVALGALRRDPGRGRTIALTLSAKGEDLLVGVRAALARNEALIARNLSSSQQNSSVTILKQICHNVCSAIEGQL
jgi:DNA-binding MarR family transcriptional regulator